MKKHNVYKKMNLNKKTIANLGDNALVNFKGGFSAYACTIDVTRVLVYCSKRCIVDPSELLNCE